MFIEIPIQINNVMVPEISTLNAVIVICLLYQWTKLGIATAEIFSHTITEKLFDLALSNLVSVYMSQWRSQFRGITDCSSGDRDLP